MEYKTINKNNTHSQFLIEIIILITLMFSATYKECTPLSNIMFDSQSNHKPRLGHIYSIGKSFTDETEGEKVSPGDLYAFHS